MGGRQGTVDKHRPAVTFEVVMEPVNVNATAFTIPDEAVERLVAGKRPAVIVTIGEYSWRSTVSRQGGRYYLVLNRAAKQATGLGTGDTAEVMLTVDTAPRVVEPPPALASALAGNAAARAAFEALPPSHRREYATWIEEARREETRARRVASAIERLVAGQRLR